MSNVTEDQLLEEIRKHIEGTDPEERREVNTITRPEMMVDLGIGHVKATRYIQALKNMGIIKPDMVWRVDDWQRKKPVPGYRLVK